MLEITRYQTILKLLTEAVSETTGICEDKLEPQVPIERFGLSSTVIMELTNALETRLPTLTTTMFFRHRTLESLARHLAESCEVEFLSKPMETGEADAEICDEAISEPPESDLRDFFEEEYEDLDGIVDLTWLEDWEEEPSGPLEHDIAIIGMAGEYPGAKNLDEFWENLKAGRDCIVEVPQSRWNHDEWFDADKDNQSRTYSKWGGFIEDHDQFDARFFNISAKEAKNMDPQERRFLHTAWSAIESAGYCRKTLSGTHTGVFIGAMWALYNLYGSEQTARGNPETTSSMFSSIANRLSWWLNLRGPSIAVDTMCSSSLTALHLACQSIQNGDCEQAIVGGVNICSHPLKYLHLARGGFASEDGRCRAFGKNGSGYVPGEGVGVVMVKPLAKALSDKDNILAVVKATSLAHGGNTSGYTVPSAEGQEAVLLSTLNRRSIDPEKVVYVEAHGTGTSLGDPIEIEGLQKVYGDRDGKLKIGSVKSNIGHLESCAGLAGLHKIVLQFQNRALVSSLHIQELNPFVNWNKLSIEVQDRYEPMSFKEDDLMGLSAFGAGGTNAHAIIAPAPVVEMDRQIDEPIPVVLSAPTADCLDAQKRQLADWLESHMEANLARIGYTLMYGRDAFDFRFAAQVETNEELLLALRADENTYKVRDKNLLAWVNKEQDLNLAWHFAEQRKIALPTYIFQSKSYWIAEPVGPRGLQNNLAGAYSETPTTEVFYAPKWATIVGKKTQENDACPDAIIFDCAMRELAVQLKASHFPNAKIYSSAALENMDHDISTILFLAGSDEHQSGFENVKWLQRPLANDKKLSCLAVSDEQSPSLQLEFLRVLCAEYSGFSCASVYLEKFIAEEILAAWNFYTTQELPLGKIFRVHNGEVQTMDFSAISSRKSRPVVAENVHLLTGGTGGIALEFAKDLVSRGARNLLLAGRKDLPRDYAQSVIDEMKAQGADVRYVQLDLVDEKKMQSQLTDALKGRKLGMIFHFAGSFDASTPAFISKDQASVDQVVEAKYSGAVHLIRVAESLDADEVVLASSLASVFPELAVGAVDYAAANAGLNRLSISSDKVRTRSLILPNWEDVGFGKSSSPFLKAQGIKGVTSNTGNALIHAALSTNAPVVMILPHEEQFDLTRAMKIDRVLKCQNDQDQKDEAQHGSVTRAYAVFNKESISDENGNLVEWLAELFYPIVEIEVQDWNPEDDFAALGVDSIALARMARALEAQISVPVPPHILIENSNLNKLAQMVASFEDAVIPSAEVIASLNSNEETLDEAPVIEEAPRNLVSEERGIAIVGIGSILPGSEGVEAFWDKLVLGEHQITEVPASRWDVDYYYGANKAYSVPSKWGGFVTGLEYFNPSQFGLPKEVAADTDPLVRLALWGTSYALADAGISPSELSGVDAGVFIGSRVANWAERIPKVQRSTVLGTAQNFISAHISHWLNINGPSHIVDTACSSSLYAIHQACNSLNLGECSVAIAGGSEVLLDEKPYQRLGETGAMSPTGLCRTFDESADGFVPGEGACIFILKRLDDALNDGDRIYAVIEGSSVNNDGRTMGVTTPNPEAQKKVILDAMKRAGVKAHQLGYIEAHGTGTQLGDPMETKSLAEAFLQNGEQGESLKLQACGIGSVKSNIGHCLSAAGAASAAKTALSIFNKKLVPTLNCDTPNSRFSFENSPFFPVDKLADFPETDGVCRAGINAFGFGGTNVHVQMSNRHLELDYKPMRVALDIPNRDGPYAWHPRVDPDINAFEISNYQEPLEFQLTQYG